MKIITSPDIPRKLDMSRNSWRVGMPYAEMPPCRWAFSSQAAAGAVAMITAEIGSPSPRLVSTMNERKPNMPRNTGQSSRTSSVALTALAWTRA